MIYILGEKPGKNTDHTMPFYPHTTTGAAARLIKLMNVTTEWYLANTIRQNAVDTDISTTHGRPRTEAFLNSANGQPFVVMRRSALNAMPIGYRKMNFGDVWENVLLIPHTSGMNRLYNDEAFTKGMSSILHSHIEKSS